MQIKQLLSKLIISYVMPSNDIEIQSTVFVVPPQLYNNGSKIERFEETS